MIRNLILSLLAAAALNVWAAAEVNQASRADLETVKGIGPGLSAKILEARKAGNFKDWGDLVERVGGIGAGNAARLSQAGLTVGGAAFDGKASTAPVVSRKSDKAADKAPEKAAASDKSSKGDKQPKA